MIKYILLCFILILFSCKKESFNIQNLNGNKIDKLGHAGLGIGDTYPMNSLESILHCLSYDMDGSEFDVQMTKDSVLVLYHDEFLESKTNFKGKINQFTWEELKNVTYTITPHLSYNLVRLQDLFDQVDAKKHTFAFDIKLYPELYSNAYLKTFSNQVYQFISSQNLEDKIMIESQDTSFLNLMEQKNANLKTFFYPPNFDEGLSAILKHGFYGITISVDDISKEQVELAHSNQIFVCLWNTHSKKLNKEAILKNADIIETDKVEYLSKLIP